MASRVTVAKVGVETGPEGYLIVPVCVLAHTLTQGWGASELAGSCTGELSPQPPTPLP